MEGMHKLTKTTGEAGSKQKRQLSWSPIRRRKKRNRSFSYYDNEEDSDESDSEHEDESNEYDEAHYSHNRDRLEDTNDQPYPFWDTYDTLNQYYLEIGE